MSYDQRDDPRCPECGGPIGATATYCMHCGADLTAERARADADADGYWDDAADATTAGASLLDPDGLLDDTLTVVVGVGGGLVVGVVGTVVLLILTESEWGVWLGLLAWIAATVRLARRPTVLDAVAETAYGVALVLLFVPFVAFGASDNGVVLATRVVVFLTMLGAVAVPAAVAAGVGLFVSRRYGSDATT